MNKPRFTRGMHGFGGASVKEAIGRLVLYMHATDMLMKFGGLTRAAAERHAKRTAEALGKDRLYVALSRLGFTYVHTQQSWIGGAA